MEVTVIIPDQFADQLIPNGRDTSRVLLEKLVDEAQGNGRINAAQADEILGLANTADEVDGYIKRHEHKQDKLEEPSHVKPNPRWANNPEQARLHAIVDKFIGCIDDPDFPRSDNVSEAVKEILMEKYERSQKTGPPKS
jgi:hypothetical protein